VARVHTHFQIVEHNAALGAPGKDLGSGGRKLAWRAGDAIQEDEGHAVWLQRVGVTAAPVGMLDTKLINNWG